MSEHMFYWVLFSFWQIDNLMEKQNKESSPVVLEVSVMGSIIKQLECNDFAIRKNAINLLNTLMRDDACDVQQAIMNVPMGVSKIVDLLQEEREFIRNDVVLMLSELSRGNSALQCLLAYENTFRLLFLVIEKEPLDSIVVEDCMVVMLNMLKDNPVTSNFFVKKESDSGGWVVHSAFECVLQQPGYVEDLGPDSIEWTSQKIANFIFVVQIIRIIVSSMETAESRRTKIRSLAGEAPAEETERNLKQQFEKLHKFLEDELLKVFRPYGEFMTDQQAQTDLIATYKNTIETQEQKIKELTQQRDALTVEATQLKAANMLISKQEPSKTILEETVKELEQRLDYGWKEYEALRAQLQESVRQSEEKDAQVKQLQALLSHSNC
uniref:GBD/FH3 domain-containing protein n=1 Tax=Ditylenchus dipsaci TaxID=166011 RepID=A0A915EPX1_9BILA